MRTDEDEDVDYDFDELDELAHAYAMTIHRSQGTEYPAVVIPVTTSAWMMLQRNLLYTAVTRAKKLVVLVGSRRRWPRRCAPSAPAAATPPWPIGFGRPSRRGQGRSPLSRRLPAASSHSLCVGPSPAPSGGRGGGPVRVAAGRFRRSLSEHRAA